MSGQYRRRYQWKMVISDGAGGLAIALIIAILFSIIASYNTKAVLLWSIMSTFTVLGIITKFVIIERNIDARWNRCCIRDILIIVVFGGTGLVLFIILVIIVDKIQINSPILYYTLAGITGSGLGIAAGNYQAFTEMNNKKTGQILSAILVVFITAISGWVSTQTKAISITTQSFDTAIASGPTAIKATSHPGSSGSAVPIKVTPTVVAAGQGPLAIDFIIDDIEIGSKTVKLYVTVTRHKNTDPLPWYSDKGSDEIFFKAGVKKYKLLDVGGIFAEDTELQPGQSYTGWLSLERPNIDTFYLYHPSIKPVQIDLSRINTAATPTATPSPTRTSHQTATPEPTNSASTPKPAASISCRTQPRGDFAGLWSRHPDWFGCPIEREPLYGQFAEMPFEHGHLFWIGYIDRYNEVKQIIATFGGQNAGDKGTWSIHPDTWNGEGICGVPPPPREGLYLPDRGLAKVWCEVDGINTLGYATAPKEFIANRGIAALQNFKKAIIFRDSDGHTRGLVYVLFRDSHQYIRVPY